MAGHVICSAISHLQNNAKEYLNHLSDLKNIYNGNNCEQTSLTVVQNNSQPSLDNLLQDIENICSYRVSADIFISLTPLSDHILHDNGLIDLEKDNITDSMVGTEVDIISSSLFEK